MLIYLTSKSRAPGVDVSDDIPVEEIYLSVNDANDVQVLSDTDKDKNTDGKSEDDDQPVDLSVACAKESREENLCPVDYSKPNANATDQCVTADDQTDQNVTPVGDQETDEIIDTEPGADEPVEAQDDKSMHSDLLSDVDESVQDPGADTDTTVEYSEDTMAEIPVGQND